MTHPSLAVRTTVAFLERCRTALDRKWSFLGVFMIVLLISTGTLAAADALPNPIPVRAAETAQKAPLVLAPATAITASELPTKIEIPTIGLSVTVSNPTSTNVEALDQALLSGAVRYPTSAALGATGNVILFGHSSYLPIVNNQAYKAFDGIQKLQTGDRITVKGSAHSYVYSVDTVVKASTEADAIPLVVSGSHLTLATCNSFGQKSDRFVVSATLVETNPL
jgi:LPXTG-site transpeptidase (sortase) family protein